jgi:hypothetical protein
MTALIHSINKKAAIVENTRFIIPYADQKMSFWNKVSDLYGSQIREVYFPIIDEQIGSGRPKQPGIHLTEFLESKVLPVSVLINPVVLPRPVCEIEDRIIRKIEYYLENYNLLGLTLTNLSLAVSLKKRFPSLKFTASTLMEICNEQQLVMLGDVFDSLVPSTRILRDLEALTKIREAFTGQIRLMVNEACLSSCLYRTQHFFEMTIPEISYPKSLCSELLARKPWLRITGGWVLPQHLFMFEGVYDDIKLAGRIAFQDPVRYMKVLKSYINTESLSPHEIGGGPSSVNVAMDISADFYRYTLSCRKNCYSCTVCSDYWNKMTKKYE